eukprot:CAMPEP_0115475970 /NCGR_PEP_ID=MMETSP0271-20121206/54890_1 /TAXON_ID=71861 /ORGANISM="Scrippsiella trochoidea, Strain CCMP3099" /LENGTH=32 /DNA_ID= /DNA_START= /DNA_END= /DNA_ORIENTATION=
MYMDTPHCSRNGGVGIGLATLGCVRQLIFNFR